MLVKDDLAVGGYSPPLIVHNLLQAPKDETSELLKKKESGN